ncbi:hypothetical protein OC842_002643 [Tilletia horrida]|uniref:Uncharacterized protein n=1 Tax=Tilletia horrida TaxID=155126 RepID=A0AAN6JKY5_9BASI|nr:hypothetical protein OC842_002643 [Tilletia horrida]
MKFDNIARREDDVNQVAVEQPINKGSGADGKHSYTLPIITAADERRAAQATPPPAATADADTARSEGDKPILSRLDPIDQPGKPASQDLLTRRCLPLNPGQTNQDEPIRQGGVDGYCVNGFRRASDELLSITAADKPDLAPQLIATPLSAPIPRPALTHTLPTAIAAASVATTALAERFITIGGDDDNNSNSNDHTTDGKETFNNWDNLNHTQKVVVIVCSVVAGILLICGIGLCVVCCGRRRSRNSSRAQLEHAHHQREVGGSITDEAHWNEGKTTPAFYHQQQQQQRAYGDGYPGSTSTYGGAQDPFQDTYAATKH